MLDVTSRIAQIQALLDTDSSAASIGASAPSTDAIDFATALSGALGGTTPAVTPAATQAAPALPDPASIPAGYALVPLTALGLGAGAPPAANLAAAPVASASAVSVPTSVVPTPSAQAAQRVALAAAEIGVAEEPPGSNDSPRIADYRTATANAGVGPWCAYFTSWIGAQAGTPLGPNGAGEGYVPTMASWLRGEGRYVTPEQATPRPGDLIFFDWERDGELDHIGLVQSVGADGRVYTIEGNADNKVTQRSWRPDQIAGYGLLP
jgi:cell wall-associated NlpC family hydrolase